LRWFAREGRRAGIAAQEEALTEIIDALVTGKIGRDGAVAQARKVRRVFDIVPQLQANWQTSHSLVI
jgi:hypothetical protein